MSESSIPDYYQLLHITDPESATQNEIRQGYLKESLKTHPDRLANAALAEIKQATEHFKAVAEAYYVLSDHDRRQKYDILLKTHQENEISPEQIELWILSILRSRVN